MKNLFLIITVLFLGISVLNAQAPDKGNATIKGNIKDKKSQLPVEYATVALHNSKDSALVTGTVTDAAGNFLLSKISTGNFFLVVKFMGYQNLNHDNIVISGKNESLELNSLFLEETATELNEVNVVGTIAEMNVKIDKKVVNVDRNISAAGGNAMDALKTSPSITIDQDGNALLRGSKNFKVLINNKPTALSANEVLKQMPAGKIDKIEIITNPSAKYDAEGTAGIINIITKKGFGNSTSALIDVSVGTGNKYNANANLNLNSDKINFIAGFKWKDYQQFYNMDEILTAIKNQQKRTNNIEFFRKQTDRDLGGNMTVDYSINEKSNLSYSLDAGNTNLYIDANFKYDESVENSTTHTYVYEDLHAKLLAQYFTNILNYTYKFSENNEWTNSAFYSKINYNFANNQQRFNTNNDYGWQNVSPYYTLRFENENFSTEYRLKSDFSQNFGNGAKLEAGGQIHYYHRYLDLFAENRVPETDEWTKNNVFSNEFDFSEKIYSAYSNFSGEKSGFTYSAGLRMEMNDRLIESFTVNKKYIYNKFNFFPTFSLSKSIGTTNQLGLNFSRRIDRPDEYFLNPFPDISNEFQEAHGNPELKPSITNSAELSYQKQSEKAMFSSQLYYRSTNKGYAQVISSNSDGVLILTFDNIADDKEFGMENMVNFQAAKWWAMNASVNLFGQNSKGQMNGQNFDRSAFTFDARLINSFTINKTTRAQLMAFYFHDRIGNSVADVGKFYWIDASIQKSFFNDNLSVTLQAKDILNTNKLKFDINRDDYRFYIHRKPEYPVILLNISYKIKNFKESNNTVKTNLKIG